MTRVTKGLCLYKNSDPKGLSAPAPGLYTCIKTWKIIYKIRRQRFFLETCNKWAKWQGFSVDIRILSTKGCLPLLRGYIHVENIVWNLQQMVKVIRAFCWHQKFVPKGFSALAPGLYTCIKSLKMCIKSDFRRDHFETCNIWAKREGLSVVIKILSPVDCLPLQKKMYIKLHFKPFFFFKNLQQMGKVIRAFCSHQKFGHEGLSAQAPGLYTYIKSFKMCIKSDFIF